MDNVFINNRIMEDSSEDSSEESSSDNEDIFLDNGSKKKYEMIRNKFFTKNVSKKIIVVDSHNYYQGDVGFNTSNFDVLFDFEKKKKEDSSSMVTTNYNIFQNVIGFRLLKATIRTPPYNVNKTNNIIKYKCKNYRNSLNELEPDKIHTITINPGLYDVSELAEVFQSYRSRINYLNNNNYYSECRIATTKNINGVTYDSINNTITVALTNDITINTIFKEGVSLEENDRILIKDQDNKVYNGIYNIIQLSNTIFVIKRALDFNSSTNIIGGYTVYIREGSLNSNKSFSLKEFNGGWNDNIEGGNATDLIWEEIIPKSQGWIEENYSQFVTYSDRRVYTPDNSTITSNTSSSNYINTPYTFNATFNSSNERMIGMNKGSDSNMKGLIFKFNYFGGTTVEDDEISILWDYDNVTRGASRLFGFLPRTETSVASKTKETNGDVVLYSNRLLDISSHFVDLVIPEIPSISCKRNSSGRDIIERIQLKADHGEYLHYRTNETDKIVSYFTPIKLHRINIQLWTANNEVYDTNNSDISFEFEITMLKNINFLE